MCMPFVQAFPERVFDVGIAEQHAVTFAAGLACEGLVPFVAIYSTFLQRGYDQVVHDVSLQNLPGGSGRFAGKSLDLAMMSGIHCRPLLLVCSEVCDGPRWPGWCRRRYALRSI